jgi:hypothetical protein
MLLILSQDHDHQQRTMFSDPLVRRGCVLFWPLTATSHKEPDLLIKSNSGDFLFAHMKHLTAASAAFEDMVALGGQAVPEVKDSERPTPTVDLSESSAVLQLLLQSIYPGNRSRPKTFEDLVGAFHAADKYQTKCLADSMRAYLIWPDFLHTRPMAIYSISKEKGYSEEAQIALEALYKVEQSKLLAEDLTGVLAKHLAEVIKLRQERADKIMNCVSAEGPRFYRPFCQDARGMPLWVNHWMEATKSELANKPDVASSISFELLESSRRKAPACKECRGRCTTWDPTHFREFKARVASQTDMNACH